MNTYEKTGEGVPPIADPLGLFLFTPIALYKGRTLVYPAASGEGRTLHTLCRARQLIFLFLNSFRTLCTDQIHGKRHISLVFNFLRTLSKTMAGWGYALLHSCLHSFCRARQLIFLFLNGLRTLSCPEGLSEGTQNSGVPQFFFTREPFRSGKSPVTPRIARPFGG